MKHLVLLLILMCMHTNISAQNDPTLYPSIEIKDISIKSSSGTLVPLNSTAKFFTKVFGRPDSIINEYWEMDEKTAKIYYYRGSRFDFLDDKFVSFDIADSSFHVGNAEADTFVGADINTMASFFPHVSDVHPADCLTANINDNEILLDEFILFEYNSDKKITKIRIGTY